ncbi:single-stranded DNA-binding protein [candidate division WWE3 bacterium]|uniref:Single-stranded DNA-binding protein n=1 Tax=candidate division WWE3 bacterium TaxID=2053526 RepID=A0A7X9DL07_UNCKA|nr:single-stranded DNA-binding protein [candidate division WWE3 bacterium]
MATRNLNKVMLIGNLTRDPEMRYTPQGNAVASFVIATNREWVTSGERKQAADFHNVVAWNKLAEICGQLLKKGTKVYVEGRLQTRTWQDPQGSKKYKTEIVIDDMIILSKIKQDGSVDDDDIIGDEDTGFGEGGSDNMDFGDLDFDLDTPKETK